ATVHSDQYAFAVSLYEALAGTRPPSPLTTAGPGTADGSRPLLDAPAHVARAVDRALSPDPAARFPSMTALLDALAPPPRRRALWTLALAVPVAAVAIALYSARGGDRCSGSSTRLAAVWSPEARARFPAVAAHALDDYSRRWAEMARATCEATQRGEQSVA